MAHVSLITLGVDDLDATTGFYEALGWERSSASVPGVVSFLQGTNIALGLFGRRDLATDAELPSAPTPSTGSICLAMNLPSVPEVDAVIAQADAAGGSITKAPRPTEWGGYSGYFTDPEGHLWEVAYNPGFPLGDDGQVSLPR